MKIIKRLPGLPAERALKVLSGRWKTEILHALLDGPQRTRDLELRVSGISQKVLLEQLQALEEHRMVSRQSSTEHRQGIEIPAHFARRKPAAHHGVIKRMGNSSRQDVRRGR
jgi:DNA-binding HxlR family transcriptional regulator